WSLYDRGDLISMPAGNLPAGTVITWGTEPTRMSLYDRIGDLPLQIEEWSFERHERDTSSGSARTTTVFSLASDNETGRGEDVTYDAGEHDALAENDPDWDLAGEYTLESF